MGHGKLQLFSASIKFVPQKKLCMSVGMVCATAVGVVGGVGDGSFCVDWLGLFMAGVGELLLFAGTLTTGKLLFAGVGCVGVGTLLTAVTPLVASSPRNTFGLMEKNCSSMAPYLSPCAMSVSLEWSS